MEDQIDHCLQIESDLLARQIGFGDSLEKGRIPWLISPEGYKLTDSQVGKLNQVGLLANDFFKAAIKLYQQELAVRQLLDNGKPKLVLDFQKKALADLKSPRLFRVDLLLAPDDTFRVVEFSLKPGGTGITAGLQEAYPGRMVGEGVLSCYKRLLDEGRGKGLFAVAREKSRSITEFKALCLMLNRDGYCCRSGYPDELTVEQADLVYSYLPPRTWGQYRDFIEQAQKRASVLVPPSYVFLKEKALFGLLWDPRWEKFWSTSVLNKTGFRIFKDLLIETSVIDHRGKFSLNGQELGFKDLLELTTSQRSKYLIKLSGFAQGSSGAKGVILGKEVGRADWQKALLQARQSFINREGLYVLQPFVPSQKVLVSWLDWEAGEIKQAPRYLRVLAYYFVLDGQAVLAGVEVNSSAKSKVHLQTDVTSVPGIVG